MKLRVALTVLISALSAPLGASAQLIGVEFDTGRFYSISMVDGSLSIIGDTGIQGIGSIEFNPIDGKIYGFTTGQTPVLHEFVIPASLDQVTATPIGPLGVFTFEGGLAFSPTGSAFAVNGGVTVPALLSVNLATGQASVVDSFEARHDFAGLGWRSDGFLIGLDSTDNALMTINATTAAVTTIDQIDSTIGSVGGMALGEKMSFFVTGGPTAVNPGSNSLYSFDPFTGDHFLIANYEDQILGTGFSGLTIIPEPGTLALLVLGGIALARRRK